MRALFAERILGLPWALLALAAGALAVVWLVVDTAGQATGLRWVVLRWCHALCWLLLALAALAKAQVTPLPVGWAPAFATAGGIAYLAFLLTTVLSRG